jgi:hypothetical protein
MGARWYDPTLRTFLSRDPAGYAFSFDEWAYTVGDPWNFVDRTGWGPESCLNTGSCTWRQMRAIFNALARGWEDNGTSLEALLNALLNDRRSVANGIASALSSKIDAYRSAAIAGDVGRFFRLVAWDVYSLTIEGPVSAMLGMGEAIQSGDPERIGSATANLVTEVAMIMLDVATGGARRAAGALGDVATDAAGASGAAAAATRRAPPDGAPAPPTASAPASASTTTANGTNTGRLSQDVAVSSQPPRALSLTGRKIGASAAQNDAAERAAEIFRQAGFDDIRINQQQVDARGNRVGINRPDLQATNPHTGLREYYEFDTSSSTRGPGHAQRILANDGFGVVFLITMD